MMAERTYVVPGEELDQSLIPSHPSLPLKLGPGLRHIPPNTLIPTVAGQLFSDAKKNAIWVESDPGRYIPTVGDLVIATIHHGASDVYYASITDYSSHATLPNLSFENATKKTRPQLNQGNLVYARVTLANKHMDPEIECVSSSTGKSEGLGPLTGGMLFPVSLAMARRLMLGNPVTQGELGVLRDLSSAGLAFEIAVGRNGRVWVNSKSVKITMVVGRAIMETDENALGMGEQAKLVQRLVREMGL